MKRTFWTFRAVDDIVAGNVTPVDLCSRKRRKKCKKNKTCSRMVDGYDKAINYCRKITIEVKAVE